MFGVDPNCEYVWNSVSVYHAWLAGLQRKPTKSVAAVKGNPLVVRECALAGAVAPIRLQ
jgi:hypothetical protein